MKSHDDSTKHHRRSIRLPDYDYASPGAYFVTIVTHNRECLFANGVFRRIAEWNWMAIPRHFERVTLDAWVVMPNHIHGIIVITDEKRDGEDRGEAFTKTRLHGELGGCLPDTILQKDGLANASPLQGHESPAVSRIYDVANAVTTPAGGVPPGALGAIAGNFKSTSTRRINGVRHERGLSIWQVNYYEHIVRNDRDLDCIRAYIAANPSRWAYDRENRSGLTLADDCSEYEKIWFCINNMKSSNA
jgi:REP element-mobilizing transposase RayT